MFFFHNSNSHMHMTHCLSLLHFYPNSKNYMKFNSTHVSIELNPKTSSESPLFGNRDQVPVRNFSSI